MGCHSWKFLQRRIAERQDFTEWAARPGLGLWTRCPREHEQRTYAVDYSLHPSSLMTNLSELLRERVRPRGIYMASTTSGKVTPGNAPEQLACVSEELMRNAVFGLLAITGAGFAGLPASAAPWGTAPQPQARLVEQTQGYGYCRRLRRACEFKRERGEVGEGNCAR
jgi:hypothetical protein